MCEGDLELTDKEKELYDYTVEVLKKYFMEHGKVSRDVASDVNIDFYSTDKLYVPYWAFYKVLDRLVDEGLVRLEPVTEVVDYMVVWCGDKN